MERVRIERGPSTDDGTFSRISFGPYRRYCGELPWRDNAPGLSCIPPGLYVCRWTWSPSMRKWTYEVTGVRGRSGIRIHSANFVGDATKGKKCQLRGCIAPGTILGVMDGQRAVLVSASAVRELETYLNHEPFELEIVDHAVVS